MYSADENRVMVVTDFETGKKELFLTVHDTEISNPVTTSVQAKILARWLNENFS